MLDWSPKPVPLEPLRSTLQRPIPPRKPGLSYSQHSAPAPVEGHGGQHGLNAAGASRMISYRIPIATPTREEAAPQMIELKALEAEWDWKLPLVVVIVAAAAGYGAWCAGVKLAGMWAP
ncbi:hypothetical protein FN846DRAFT_889040 [Sphaerosporella brunnea]|uniref:Uncharacterized protein n=1 Tax=Sphaerosporella brunnea TaxID=1250544 RepID=A0A5J5F0S4_9PEZI|nr:hypothetical protein FN846DRAFT_889040 [Sphaerosporella brunnea]